MGSLDGVRSRFSGSKFTPPLPDSEAAQVRRSAISDLRSSTRSGGRLRAPRVSRKRPARDAWAKVDGELAAWSSRMLSSMSPALMSRYRSVVLPFAEGVAAQWPVKSGKSLEGLQLRARLRGSEASFSFESAEKYTIYIASERSGTPAERNARRRARAKAKRGGRKLKGRNVWRAFVSSQLNPLRDRFAAGLPADMLRRAKR